MWSLCATVWYEPTDADKACKPFLSDAWKSLTYSSPNLVELCTMTRTLGIPTPDGKFLPQWLCLILELKYFIKEFKVVGKCVKLVKSLVPPALPSSLTEVLSVALTLSRPLLEHIHCLIVTLGAKGVLVCGEHEAGSVDLQPRRQQKVCLEETWLHVVKKNTHSKESEAMYYCVWQRKQLCAVHYPALTLPAEETVNVSGAGDRCKKISDTFSLCYFPGLYFHSFNFPMTPFSLFPSRLTSSTKTISAHSSCIQHALTFLLL